MGTLRSDIYDVLQADAQLDTGTELGTLLGLSATEPYGVYLVYPPESVDYETKSVITYSVLTEAGKLPRDIYLTFTAWGGNYVDIQARIYTLLHEIQLTPTDFEMLQIQWDWAGPDSYDEGRHTYYQQHRYLVKAVKK